jgi:hypothetical protein
MEILLKSGDTLYIDLNKWTIAKDTNCKILEDIGLNYKIQNKNGLSALIPKATLKVNHIEIVNSQVQLSENLYQHYMVKPNMENSISSFETMFNKNTAVIFNNRNLIFNKAEYYLLKPKLLTSGGSMGGSFNYCLGSLIEAWENSNELYFENIQDHKNLYFIAVSGSPLSGHHICTFWSYDENRLITLDSKEARSVGNSFIDKLKKLKNSINSYNSFSIDFQDVAIKNLLTEIESIKNQ